MTRQEIYQKIVRIADELEDVNFSKRLFDAVQNRDKETFNRLIELLKRYKSRAYNDIIELGNRINILMNTHNKSNFVIFSDKEKTNKGINFFDVNKYDSLTLFTISLLGKFEIGDLFENWGSSNSSFAFAEDIARYGFEHLSSFVIDYCNYYEFYKNYSNLYDFILDILNGRYEK